MNHTSTLTSVSIQLAERDALAYTGIPFILGETNSLYNEGKPGLSNSFGAALCTLSFSFSFPFPSNLLLILTHNPPLHKSPHTTNPTREHRFRLIQCISRDQTHPHAPRHQLPVRVLAAHPNRSCYNRDQVTVLRQHRHHSISRPLLQFRTNLESATGERGRGSVRCV